MILAALLRLAIFPHGLSPSEGDEPGYLSDGLLMIEGVTPGHKYAPSGPLTWFGTVYAGVGALITWSSGGADLANFPALLRPVAALEATLFDIYSDMSSLRVAVVALIVLLSLASVWAICRLGDSIAGLPGLLISGLVAASVPLYVDLSTQTRPYAIAWAFALLAFAAAGAGNGSKQALRAGIFLGLAMGSHVDMIRVAPFILLVQWRQSANQRPPWRAFGTIITASAITFLLIAPWYVTHFIDNVRQILSVRLLPAAGEGLSNTWFLWWDAGILPLIAVTSAGLLLASVRRHTPDLLCGLWFLVNAAVAFRPSAHGLHHDGALLVALIALSPIAVAALRNQMPFLRAPIGTTMLVVVATGPVLWQGVSFALREASSRTPDDAIAWIEQNVSPGTRVYVEGPGMATLLPTSDAAERLWADVAAPDAWIPKYYHDIHNFGLGGARPLRVMSEDRIASDTGNRRRFLILGAPLQSSRPRYDLWIVSDGSFYDLSSAAAVDRLCSDGGVYLHHGESISRLPSPEASWLRAHGESTFIYRVAAGGCSA